MLEPLLPSVAIPRGSTGIFGQLLFGFASYATVLPIVVEFQWLFIGTTTAVQLPPSFARHVIRWRFIYIAFGTILMATPLQSDLFWLNQGAWAAPTLFLHHLGSRRRAQGTGALRPPSGLWRR